MLTRDILHNKSVVVSVFKDAKYNTVPPYHPQRLYPEYPFGEKNINTGDDGNPDAYESTREIFRMLEYDKEHYDTKEWNPLGVIIKQGQNVVIKPNFVLHLNEGGYDIFANLTHPSVIRALIDYTYIALKGQGTITIAEAPQMDCEFEVIEQIMHLQAIVDFYNQTLNFPITILDIRRLKCKRDPVKKYYPAESFIYNDNADPQGYAIVNLGSLSMLDELDGIDGLYGSDYDRSFTSENHHKGVHRYCI